MKILHRKIFILLTVSVLSTTLLTSVAGLLSATKLIKKDSHQILKLMSDSNSGKINSWFESIENTVTSLYNLAKNQLPSDTAYWSNQEYMDSYIQKMRSDTEIFALNTDSAITVYLRINPEYLSSESGFLLVKNSDGIYEDVPVTDIALFNSSDRNHVGWWYEPIQHKKPLWLLPYYNQNLDIEMISYVIPIYSNNELFGVIGMDFALERLEKKVAEISLYETGDAMLLDKNNEIIFSDRFANLKKQPGYENEIKKIRNLKKINYDAISQSYVIKIFNENIRFSVSTLLNDMKLVIMVPEKEINRDRNLLILQCLLIIFLGLSISIFFCAKFTNRLTKSLGKITASVQEIAKGNYDVSVEVEKKNEFEELARSFNEAAKEFDKNSKQINKLAYTDSLTGLKNRNCFNKFRSGLEAAFPKNIGVIFCDLNRLKFTNDNYGHKAGDRLICTFADLLKENFSDDECFRMSGDEFIIVIMGLTETDFEQIVKDFILQNKKQDVPFASIGSCWRSSTDNLSLMIKSAETCMYRDKKEFYKRFPEFKR